LAGGAFERAGERELRVVSGAARDFFQRQPFVARPECDIHPVQVMDLKSSRRMRLAMDPIAAVPPNLTLAAVHSVIS
jgi:hypothetical protein